MTDLDKGSNTPLDKEVVKEALKEWLDDRFAALGKWTAGAFAAVVFIAFVYFTLNLNGWHK